MHGIGFGILATIWASTRDCHFGPYEMFGLFKTTHITTSAVGVS